MSGDSPFSRLLSLLNPEAVSDLGHCSGENAHIAAAAIIQRALCSNPAFHEEVRMLTDPTVEGCRCRPAIAQEEAGRGRAAFAAGDMAAAAEHFSAALADTDATAPGGGAAAARLLANRAACLLRMRGAALVPLAAADADEVTIFERARLLPIGLPILPHCKHLPSISEALDAADDRRLRVALPRAVTNRERSIPARSHP